MFPQKGVYYTPIMSTLTKSISSLKKDNMVAQHIKDPMKCIHPDELYIFCLSNFCEIDMQFIEKEKPSLGEQPPHILARSI